MSISSTSPLGALSSLLTNKPMSASANLKSPDDKSAGQKFLDTIGENPAQRMFNAMLGQLGLTQEQFQAMDPAEQQKITQKIEEMIKQQVEKTNDQRTGLIADKTV